MSKHESTDITLETNVGYSILDSIGCNLHLIDQCIVVGEWLCDVASLVIPSGELGYVDTGWDARSPRGVGTYLAYHVDIGGCVAEGGELLQSRILM